MSYGKDHYYDERTAGQIRKSMERSVTNEKREKATIRRRRENLEAATKMVREFGGAISDYIGKVK